MDNITSFNNLVNLDGINQILCGIIRCFNCNFKNLEIFFNQLILLVDLGSYIVLLFLSIKFKNFANSDKVKFFVWMIIVKGMSISGI